MATDEVYSYWWSFGGSKGVLMKKVNLLNNFYSLSYQFLIHEVIQSVAPNLKDCPKTIVMEIEENFKIQLTEKDIYSLNTVEKIKKFLKKKK